VRCFHIGALRLPRHQTAEWHDTSARPVRTAPVCTRPRSKTCTKTRLRSLKWREFLSSWMALVRGLVVDPGAVLVTVRSCTLNRSPFLPSIWCAEIAAARVSADRLTFRQCKDESAQSPSPLSFQLPLFPMPISTSTLAHNLRNFDSPIFHLELNGRRKE
jgi:hypothetical protein